MTLITPKSLTKLQDRRSDTPVISVYSNLVRFNKAAARLMQLPGNVVFDLEENVILISPDGFRVIVSGSWHEFVIHNRSLTAKILSHYGEGKTLMKITKAIKGGFCFERINNTYFEEN